MTGSTVTVYSSPRWENLRPGTWLPWSITSVLHSCDRRGWGDNTFLWHFSSCFSSQEPSLTTLPQLRPQGPPSFHSVHYIDHLIIVPVFDFYFPALKCELEENNICWLVDMNINNSKYMIFWAQYYLKRVEESLWVAVGMQSCVGQWWYWWYSELATERG